MIIKVAPADSAGIEDIVQRGRLEAVKVKQRTRRLDDPLSASPVPLYVLLAQRRNPPL
jgi:hypothetical protein